MILQGDVIDKLKEIETGTVQCVVTSPPYWGLRDYGTAEWEGGDEDCNHYRDNHVSNSCTTGHSTSQKSGGVADSIYKTICKKCGAKRIDQQLGLEETPELYVDKMVEVFREVKRVLKNDGTVFLNLGDSYASVHTGGQKSGKSTVGSNKVGIQEIRQSKASPHTYGLKAKDLVGIPWRVAFALQADGWYLRQDIIWHKPNPMPESVTDRCTKSHEYIFLLTKSSKYFYDNDAIREPFNKGGLLRTSQKNIKNQIGSERGNGGMKPNGNMKAVGDLEKGRNKRSVWTITTQPYKEAHFAVFPPKIPELCIKAGTSEYGECSECGSAWERIMEKTGEFQRRWSKNNAEGSPYRSQSSSQNIYEEKGWLPTCSCDADNVPQIVLDPFFGSGTTGYVAQRLGRQWIGIELNPEYVRIAEKRFAQQDLFRV